MLLQNAKTEYPKCQTQGLWVGARAGFCALGFHSALHDLQAFYISTTCQEGQC